MKKSILKKSVVTICAIIILFFTFDLARTLQLKSWAKQGISLNKRFVIPTKSLVYCSIEFSSNYKYIYIAGSCLKSRTYNGYYKLINDTIYFRSSNLFNWKSIGHNQDYLLNDTKFLFHLDTIFCLSNDSKKIEYTLIAEDILFNKLNSR